MPQKIGNILPGFGTEFFLAIVFYRAYDTRILDEKLIDISAELYAEHIMRSLYREIVGM